MLNDIFLFLSVIVTVGSVIPYARDILKGETKPNIVSWITWTLITGVATIAELAAHEYTTAIFTSAAVVETALIVVLGLKYGYVKYTMFDTICQIGSLTGFVLWYVFNSPAAAVIASLAIDFIGVLPTLRHSFLSPGEETWETYALAGLGGLLAIFALTSYNWISLPYAVYIVLVNILVSGIIISRSRSK
jgi:hypothetical protein